MKTKDLTDKDFCLKNATFAFGRQEVFSGFLLWVSKTDTHTMFLPEQFD